VSMEGFLARSVVGAVVSECHAKGASGSYIVLDGGACDHDAAMRHSLQPIRDGAN
jgi:hypothetical protein